VRSAVVFHFLRHFPRWATRLPRHAPKLEMPSPAAAPSSGESPMSGETEPAGAGAHGP
jgi:cardiolipin synthase